MVKGSFLPVGRSGYKLFVLLREGRDGKEGKEGRMEICYREEPTRPKGSETRVVGSLPRPRRLSLNDSISRKLRIMRG